MLIADFIVLYVKNPVALVHNFLLHGRPMEAKGDWDFRISDLVKNSDGTDI